MRGLLLVAVGATLIVIAARRGGGAEASGPDEGSSRDGALVVDGQGASDLDRPSEGVGGVGDAARRGDAGGAGRSRDDGVRGDGSTAGAATDATPGATGGDAERLAAAAAERRAARERADARREAAERAARAEEAEREAGAAPASGRPAPPGTARGARGTGDDVALDLVGGSQADPRVLAVHVLEAWMAQDPSALESYIKEGEGAALPLERRQLVAAFWQACMGSIQEARGHHDRLREASTVTGSQLDLLAAALADPGTRVLPAVHERRDPLALAMRMVLLDDEARASIGVADHARAAVALSDVVHAELAAPWPPHRELLLEWGQLLRRSQDNHRLSPAGRWPSYEVRVKPGDTLIGIRGRLVEADGRRKLCTGLIAACNGITGVLGRGQVLRIPTDEPNAIVDLDGRVCVFRLGDEAVRVYEVGIGKEGNETPIGVYELGTKLEKPAYTPTGEPQREYGHPDNPLGTRWMEWFQDGRKTSVGFHGTWEPEGVGGRVSRGCVRMRNEDVEELFDLLPRGARVVVQP